MPIGYLDKANRWGLFDGTKSVPVPDIYQGYAEESHCRKCGTPKPRPAAFIQDGEIEVILVCNKCGAFVRL